MTKQPAIFLDRDGTLIDDVGYIKHKSDVRFYPFTFEALALLQERFQLFIITNQSGIAKGETSATEVENVNTYILSTLKENGIIINELFCCPHSSEDNCVCKKPKTYFIEKACQLYNIDLSKSFIIGDHLSDVQCGKNAGIIPIYLLTGHGNKHRNDVENETLICDNIIEATKYINSKNN